jgi:hypothetical protein
MTGCWGTLDQTQSTLGNEAAHGMAGGVVREMSVESELPNGKAELRFACEAAMPQKMGVDRALGKIEAQARGEIILELFPDECSIGFLVFHGFGIQKRVDSPQSRLGRDLRLRVHS